MIRRATAVALFACLFLWSGKSGADHSVVLVTNARCPVVDLSNLEIRKAYLGVSVSVDGQAIRPLRLMSDPELDRIFFQTVVAMSEKSYERRALSLALKFGTPRPAEFRSLSDALDALRDSTCAVLFLWSEDAMASEETKTIKVLWRDT